MWINSAPRCRVDRIEERECFVRGSSSGGRRDQGDSNDQNGGAHAETKLHSVLGTGKKPTQI